MNESVTIEKQKEEIVKLREMLNRYMRANDAIYKLLSELPSNSDEITLKIAIERVKYYSISPMIGENNTMTKSTYPENVLKYSEKEFQSKLKKELSKLNKINADLWSNVEVQRFDSNGVRHNLEVLTVNYGTHNGKPISVVTVIGDSIMNTKQLNEVQKITHIVLQAANNTATEEEIVEMLSYLKDSLEKYSITLDYCVYKSTVDPKDMKDINYK